MSRPATRESEAAWIARSPLPAGNAARQRELLDLLLGCLDDALQLAWTLGQQRLALALESDRLAAQQVRARLMKEMTR